ncbi:MAG TPA: methyltransferase [Candidatus Dormibacteraeota bacterium]|nr:methyltransferase [Candidatus Dormibacteraeota bacterium]
MNEPQPHHILQVGLGFWASKTLLSAVEMELFTELAKRPEDLETLQGRLGLHPRSVRDFLDALVSLKFLERRDGRYYNTPSTDFFLDKRKPSYIGGILEMANHRLYPFWTHLTTALRTGLPQNETRDGSPNPFAAIYAEPARLKEFLKAMTGVSHGANLAIAHKFPWGKYRTAVDVGTAQGDLITQVALANPHIEGTGFDLPEVGPIFEEYVEANRISRRVKFSPGSFMEQALPKADVVMMGHILHDWNLEIKRMLVRKAYEALPNGGAYIVYESIIDDDRSDNAFGLLMSLNMLIETSDGFDYTGADCSGWMKEAGFRETRVEHLIGPDSMVIGIK